MDTKKLRQKILDLAIHGKLVPQDPNDEPASVLLERIRTEKEKLIKEGKIKAPKKSKSAGDTSHYPKDVPFEVPEGWVWCRFTEVAELISGQDFPPEKYNTSAKGTPYIIGASNIEDGHLRINRWTEYPSVLSQRGDVLVVCKGAGVGKVVVNDIGTVHIARQIQAVRILDEIVSSDYMRILIDWCVPSIVTQANGLIPGLKRELLLNVLLPIPPRNEQDIIVSTLCGAFEIIKGIEVEQFKLEVDIRKSKELVLDLAIHGKLVPQDSTDEPAIELLKRINPDFQPSDNLHYDGDLPSGWALCTLADVTDYGKCVSVPVSEIGDEEWVLELEDIEKNTGRVLCRVIKKNRSLKGIRHQFYKGQVLYSKLRTYLNKVFVADDYGFCTTEIIPITANECILPEYLNLILRSPYFLDYTASRDYGVKMPRLGTSDAKKAPIPVPPVSEQARIVNVVNEWLLSFDKVRDLLKFSE